MIYSEAIYKILLERIIKYDLEIIDLITLKKYLLTLNNELERKDIVLNKKEISLNKSVDIIYDFLKEPYKSIFDEVLFTTYVFDKSNRGYFQYNNVTDERLINVPVTKTYDDAYTIIHELMHYINSFPDFYHRSRLILGEGISMSAEVLLSIFINDNSKKQYDINTTLNKIEACTKYIKLYEHYINNQELVLNELFEEVDINFLNRIVQFMEPNILEYIKYINGYLITTIIDSYDKLEYFNNEVSKDTPTNEILKKFNIEEYNNTIKKKLI